MAEADVYTKNYISRNDVFADVFNFFIYGGDQVIQADSLCDESVEEIAIVPLGEEDAETAQRYRDVLKSCVIKRDAFAFANATSLPRSLTRPHQTRALYQSASEVHDL